MSSDIAADPFYPEKPFERIAIALSGGGYRATTYSLGALSLLHSIKLTENNSNTTLLNKVIYGSSTSGGTITLSVYAACIHKGVSFDAFYTHLNNQLHGEGLVHEAIRLLGDDDAWKGAVKSRNMINAFSKVYHNNLFGILGADEDRTMKALVKTPAHLQEVCFNATEFFTGIPFKFQVAQGWDVQHGGKIGNNNIRINSKDTQAMTTLEQLRLSDVLACSSCFPTGFEPMVYPNDFTYTKGPTADAFRSAFTLDTYSTKANNSPDTRSKRAVKEKTFATKGSFSIMDGGMVDNQGLDALKEANDRKDGADSSGNRFDLSIVCDVASFYMDPYTNPEIDTSKPWMKKSLNDYWNKLRRKIQQARSVVKIIVPIFIVIAILSVMPLLLIERGFAEWALAVTGCLLLVGVWYARNEVKPLFGKDSILTELSRHESLAALAEAKLPPEKSFQNRVLVKMSTFVQQLQTGVIVQMIMARLLSSQVMISEIFLKHVRRLIFDHFYDIPKLRYRRLNNVIYKLTFSNDVNRSKPRFEDIDDGTGDRDRRKAEFLKEWEESKRLTEDMQKVAELAYSTGTTLWFENDQESDDPFKNNRRGLLATGQFTTCSNLLGYALSLKHSRHFDGLNIIYQQRVSSIIDQLKEQMTRFAADPFWLEKEFEKKRTIK